MFKILVRQAGVKPHVIWAENFDPVVFEAFGGREGSPYPIMGSDGVIYLVGFDSQRSEIVAFATVSPAEFRRRLVKEAERKFSERMQQAATEAAAEVAAYYSVALRFAEKE